MAVNPVSQGTAADLIKKAMVDVDAALSASGLGARMILQVHDELVFEAPADETDRLGEMVRAEMEGAMDLRIPIVAELGVGDNWLEAH